MKLEQYVARPFTINAVRVTEENFEEVAQWCKGEVTEKEDGSTDTATFIRIDVKRPLGDRQTKAYVGDWVLKAKGGFKVYTNDAFNRGFVAKRKPVKSNATTSYTVNNYVAGQDSPPVDAPETTNDSPKIQVEDEGTDSPRVQV